MSDHVNFDTIVLEKIKYQISMMDTFNSIDVDVDVIANHIARSIEYRFKTDILSDKLESITVEYPADWWQSIKDRFFPDFLKEKYPVIFVKHTIDAIALYPRIAIPHNEHFLKVEMNNWGEVSND